jgi:dolichyl-phosphate beta-glucosyltransferase
VELIARWIRLNRFQRDLVRGTIFEYPLFSWEDVEGSKVKPRDFLRAFVDVIRIYRRYLRA